LCGHLKNRLQSKDSDSGLHMNFFREPEKFWTKSALALWKPFSGSGSTYWTNALRQIESTRNEIGNGPLSYSYQGSDLEMLIVGYPRPWRSWCNALSDSEHWLLELQTSI
jgi:hypothetical protein